jgi:hypothetical protein
MHGPGPRYPPPLSCPPQASTLDTPTPPRQPRPRPAASPSLGPRRSRSREAIADTHDKGAGVVAMSILVLTWVVIVLTLTGSVINSVTQGAAPRGKDRGKAPAATGPPSTDGPTPPPLPPLTPEELWGLREDARDMFYHAYDAYMKYGCVGGRVGGRTPVSTTTVRTSLGCTRLSCVPPTHPSPFPSYPGSHGTK